jgi:transcriptional regulator with XRE-family HTH domain
LPPPAGEERSDHELAGLDGGHLITDLFDDAGLRRGEVATLAEVSIEYYSKLERGAIAGASASVLHAIARALQLDDAERAHLFHLAHAADGTTTGQARSTSTTR